MKPREFQHQVKTQNVQHSIYPALRYELMNKYCGDGEKASSYVRARQMHCMSKAKCNEMKLDKQSDF